MIGSMPAIDNVVEDDEDTSRGDQFDTFTPREMSIGRYKQNHELSNIDKGILPVLLLVRDWTRPN